MDMQRVKSRIMDAGPCRKELDIEVEAGLVGDEFEKVLGGYASRVKLPGFRAGKAPREMVKKMFFADIKSSALDSLASDAVLESIGQHGLRPVTRPVIGSLSWEEGKPLVFRASFEVLPEFVLPDYKKVRVKPRKAEVKDEEIDRTLEDLRQKAAEYVPVEGRGVAPGDYAVVELQRRDLKTKKLMPVEKILVLAGHAENERALEEALTGMKSQESRKFSMSYPADHADPKLAGKTFEYDMKVMSIKEKKVPEVGDELAKDLGSSGSLEELKEQIRRELTARKEAEARRETADEIVKAVLEKLPLDLPDALVEEEGLSILKDLVSSYPQRQWKREDLDQLKIAARKQAAENLKRRLILRKIAEQEGLAVSEEEVQSEIRNIARANNAALAQVTERINQEGGRESLKDHLLLRKAIDFLVQNAIME